jgi:outer membrane lipoprotein LolB
LPPRAAVDPEETLCMVSESGPPAFFHRVANGRRKISSGSSAGRLGFHGLLILLLCSLLVACASQPVAPPVGGFEASGKLAVAEGERSLTARFRWRQSGNTFAIELWGPLGQGRLRLDGDGDELRVLDAKGTVLLRGSHDEVMRRELGFTLPLAVLPDWVQGRPHSGLPVAAEVRDASGQLKQFRQLDWVVDFANWRPRTGDADPRPGRITASRGAYRVRLAVSQWHL